MERNASAGRRPPPRAPEPENDAMAESRVQKSLLNAKVNLVFYVLTLALTFFSRKIFLDCLGADFVGLSGTLQNLLAFLNLAELGVGAAIGYVLYKPLFDHDERRICEIISVFGFLYRRIGLIILALGLLLACFLPLIFPKTGFETGVVYAVYSAFLASSLIGYFCNYKQTLLGADQRNYVVTAYFQSAAIVKTLIQMACALHTGSYYLWAAIELAFGIIYSFILNWKVNQTYPWLKSDVRQGRSLLRQYPIVVRKAKQLFVHQLSLSVQFQTAPFLVYSFVSLHVVACYGNYTIITNKITILLNTFLGSTGAGIGNLIAEGNPVKIQGVFWELISLRIVISSVVCYALYQLMPPFICLWLGRSYILPDIVLFLIVIDLFIRITTGSITPFVYGYGIFWDVWAPIVQSVVYIAAAILGGYFWGLPGVLSGSIAGLLASSVLWKPFLLFHWGFKRSVLVYWRGMFLHMLCVAAAYTGAQFLLSFGEFHPEDSFGNWILYATVLTSTFALLLIGIMYCALPSMRQLVDRLSHSPTNHCKTFYK